MSKGRRYYLIMRLIKQADSVGAYFHYDALRLQAERTS